MEKPIINKQQKFNRRKTDRKNPWDLRQSFINAPKDGLPKTHILNEIKALEEAEWPIHK